MIKIDKTTYIEYLKCAKNMWLKLHKREFQELFVPSKFDQSLMQQGNVVERLAQKLFQAGVFVKKTNKADAIDLTQKHIKSKTPILFQPTFVWNDFLVRNDVLEYDESVDAWNIYEIKAKNDPKENIKKIDDIEDATFQYIVLKESGIKVGKVFIIHLNKEYIRDEQLNIDELFLVEEISNKVIDREENTRLKMYQSQKDLLMSSEQDVSCICIYSGRSNHCPTFSYSHEYVPEYSVHDIARIGLSKKKLAQLIDMHSFDINDVQDSFSLSEIQRNQVDAHKLQRIFINHEVIKRELESLDYPLYFLDYETFPSAIPRFKGFRPYQQIPFQFSLHAIMEKNSDPVHFEYLHESSSDPSLNLVLKLLEYIGPKGNIIVWNKSFEKGVNAELAQRHPEYKEFLQDINDRIYDLEDIFKKQLYIHPSFKGKTSIKNVLPVLAPDLSYKELSIQEGGAASQSWFDMTHGDLAIEDQQEIAKNLRAYCCLDSIAMYRIWKFLIKEVSS